MLRSSWRKCILYRKKENQFVKQLNVGEKNKGFGALYWGERHGFDSYWGQLVVELPCLIKRERERNCFYCLILLDVSAYCPDREWGRGLATWQKGKWVMCSIWKWWLRTTGMAELVWIEYLGRKGQCQNKDEENQTPREKRGGKRELTVNQFNDRRINLK